MNPIVIALAQFSFPPGRISETRILGSRTAGCETPVGDRSRGIPGGEVEDTHVFSIIGEVVPEREGVKITGGWMANEMPFPIHDLPPEDA
jgi:hypothetical protein